MTSFQYRPHWRRRRSPSGSTTLKQLTEVLEAESLARRTPKTLKQLQRRGQELLATLAERCVSAQKSLEYLQEEPKSERLAEQIASIEAKIGSLQAQLPEKWIDRVLDMGTTRERLEDAKGTLAWVLGEAESLKSQQAELVRAALARRDEAAKKHQVAAMGLARIDEELARREREALEDKERKVIARKSRRAAREEAKKKAATRAEELHRLRGIAAAAREKTRERADTLKGRLRRELLEHPFCPYCSEPISEDDAVADHIYPVAKGGLSTIKNLVYVCAQCNHAKGDMTLAAFAQAADLDREQIEQTLALLEKDF